MACCSLLKSRELRLQRKYFVLVFIPGSAMRMDPEAISRTIESETID